MPRVKQTGRRDRIDPCALPMPPRLSQMPEERWFDDANEKLAYDERLSKMEILPPKFIGDGVLPDEKYLEFWRLIDIQGLRPFLYMHEREFYLLGLLCLIVLHGWIGISCVLRLLAFYFNLDNLNDDGTGGFAFGFRLGGRTYEFSLLDLATVWGLKNEGVTFKGGNNPHGKWNEFNNLDMIRGLQLEHVALGKYAISRMFTDHRLLLYVLSYVLLPRKSNHGSASEEDLLILWAMVQEKQIHWPYLMAHRMLKYSQGKPTSFLAHAHLLTKVFEIAPLDLTHEDNVEPETSHAITSKNIHQMRRNLIPTDTGVPPQFQPDIAEIARKGFEDLLLAITEGFTRLSDRIDQIDTHLISQDTDLHNLRCQ
ncbi:hypothetical protein PIB30_079612 [Stylosanthes scabra]|uniref:Aminotransferase-like plant mobile domain-containing protein n=1 Tax=Stylosanthes scabra TaxID=79078 RepID=A0ABU6UPY8_9FABA|nr:hypothetical protein [Stylosanthes scabra]